LSAVHEHQRGLPRAVVASARGDRSQGPRGGGPLGRRKATDALIGGERYRSRAVSALGAAPAWVGRRCGLGALALGIATSAPTAQATEAGSGIVTGVCGVGTDGRIASDARWCGALHGDVLFGREGPGQRAFGLALDLGTAAFREATWNLGPVALLPLGSAWVTELRAGPALRWARGTVEPGLGASTFVGYRRYNYHGAYSMAWGLTVAFDRTFGSLDASALVVGARLDGVVLGLPVLFGWASLHHRRR
jgi:hypothetical protein